MKKFQEPITSVASRLNFALGIRGMTLLDLSKASGISLSSLSQYKSGYVEPKQNRIMILAKVLSVSEQWLMGYEAPMERTKAMGLDEEIMVDEDAKRLLVYYNALCNEDKKSILSLVEKYSQAVKQKEQ